MAVAKAAAAVRPMASLEGTLGRGTANLWGTAAESAERVKRSPAALLAVVSPTEALSYGILAAPLEGADGADHHAPSLIRCHDSYAPAARPRCQP
jgi:hypothetical protein